MPTKKTSKTRRAPVANDNALAGLTAALAADIASLADEPIENLVDPAAVRALLERSETLVHHEVVAELIVAASRRIARDLRTRQSSPWDLLDAELAAEIDLLLDTDIILSEDAENLVGRMMGRELIRDLFTDVIHTAIVSFNKKVNPLFGGLASAMLEDQIKGFIRFFMPLVQARATSFVVDRRNQELFSDFSRSFVRELLDEPIPNLVALVSAEQKRDATPLIHKLAASESLRAMTREMALSVWEEVFAAMRHRKLGELVDVETHAGWLAEQAAPVVTAALARPHLAAFLHREFGGVAAVPPAPKPRRTKKKATKPPDRPA